jgi:hypothetical protein
VTDTVYVTNIGERFLTDGWDGVQYTFEPGKTVQVPVFIAGHIFGYGFEDKTPHVTRLGWAKTTNDIPGALANLENFVISTEPPEVRSAPFPGATNLTDPPSSALVVRRGRRGENGAAVSLQ